MENSDIERNEEMKRYLYCEMDETEKASVEDKMFEDDSYSGDLNILEDELVNQYARNELIGEEKLRFERSLLKVNSRKAKVANTLALQDYIAENTALITPFLVETEPEKYSVFEKIKAFFNFQGFSLQYALGGLVLLMAVGLAFLAYNNNQNFNENARLQKENAVFKEKLTQFQDLQNKENESQTKIKQLESELKDKSAKNEEIKFELAKKKEELINEKNEKAEISRQREILAEEIRLNREKRGNLPNIPQQINSSNTIAELNKNYSFGSSGNQDNPETQTREVLLKCSHQSVKVLLPFVNQNYKVKVNGTSIKSSNVSIGGVKYVLFFIPRKLLTLGTNQIRYINSEGEEAKNFYDLVVKEEKCGAKK